MNPLTDPNATDTLGGIIYAAAALGIIVGVLAIILQLAFGPDQPPTKKP